MDDFVIYVSAKLLRNAARQINLTNRKIEKWEEKSGFKMSTDKTKMVIFYRNKRWLNDEVINITLNGHMIPVEEEERFSSGNGCQTSSTCHTVPVEELK